MKYKPIELLAPAGSPQAYKAAAFAGADAVYLGAKAFNARAQAQNFDREALVTVIEDAHIRAIKVYLVLNTLVKDSEIQEAAALASFAYREGIDGVIVQDPGLVRLLREIAPGLPLHASTQMTLHNTDGVKAAQKLGLQRVILSRELTLQEIKEISQANDMELEVFVHGALCISRSGQCLLSSFIGARSGNRGRCAQPCRLPWSNGLPGTCGEYLISPRDLMTLELLPELIASGVKSLKIEGRLKSPEYVAATVMVYRKYLDLALTNPSAYKVDPADINMLERVFNRGGFTKGYLKGIDFRELMSTQHPKHCGIHVGTVERTEGSTRSRFGVRDDDRLVKIRFTEQTHMGDGLEIRDANRENPSAIISVMLRNNTHVKTARPGDTLLVGNFKEDPAAGSAVYKTYDKELMDHLCGLSDKNTPRVAITGYFHLFAGDRPTLQVADEDGNTATTESQEPAQPAADKPVTGERVTTQLKKTGDTPFFFEQLEVKTDNRSYIPISVINDLRRQALGNLLELRKTALKREVLTQTEPDYSYFPGNIPSLTKKREISLYFFKVPEAFTWEGLQAHRVYLPLSEAESFDAARQYGIRAYAIIPPVLTDKQLQWAVNRVASMREKLDGVLVGNPGMLYRMYEAFPKLPVALDFQMNLFNSWALEAFREYQPVSAMLSVEMNLEAISEIKSPGIPLEAYVYGEIPVMTLEYCPASDQGSCNRKCGSCHRNRGTLTDRMGKRFQYETDPLLQRTTLYNTSRLMLTDIQPLSSTDVSVLRVGIMHESNQDVHELCRFYHAQWVEGKEKIELASGLANRLKEESLTRGHYFRGVE
ncbi:MAG: U32 family peptidase [Thermoclostridium sp.]|nr:U32 family peptidase [Thermoclostridium sp.]